MCLTTSRKSKNLNRYQSCEKNHNIFWIFVFVKIRKKKEKNELCSKGGVSIFLKKRDNCSSLIDLNQVSLILYYNVKSKRKKMSFFHL
jgi:hypothetical protein